MGWVTGTLAERMSAALRHLVRTPLGSIIWAPDYGTEFHLLRTQIVSPEDEMIHVGKLQSAAGRYIPDMTLLGLKLQGHPNEEKLDVIVTWAVTDASNVGTRASRERFAIGPVKNTISV